MANSHVLISSQTLGSAAASVTFGSGGTLPQGYRDLRLICNYISTNNSVQANIRLNGDTASNYSRVIMAGWGSSATNSASATGTSIVCMNWSAPDNLTRVSMTADFMDYSVTDKHKTVLLRSNHGNEVDGVAARWASTSAVTQIDIFPDSGTFQAGCIFSLYGVLG